MGKMWFRQRRFGWGWTPITWEGWLTVAAFIGLIFFVSKNYPDRLIPTVFGGAVLLIIIGYLKGPKPHWSWG